MLPTRNRDVHLTAQLPPLYRGESCYGFNGPRLAHGETPHFLNERPLKTQEDFFFGGNLFQKAGAFSFLGEFVGF